MTSSTDIVNQALMLIGGNQPPVSGVAPNFDSSPTGKAAALLYVPCVQTVMRSFAWDFVRHTSALALSGNAAPFPWALQYKYPTNCIELWTITVASEDINDPLPYNFSVANDVVGAVQQRVINTNLADALGVYNNYPNENTWDASFREAMVRLLASELAMAIAGKPETSQGLLESAGTFEQAGESRQD